MSRLVDNISFCNKNKEEVELILYQCDTDKATSVEESKKIYRKTK